MNYISKQYLKCTLHGPHPILFCGGSWGAPTFGAMQQLANKNWLPCWTTWVWASRFISSKKLISLTYHLTFKSLFCLQSGKNLSRHHLWKYFLVDSLTQEATFLQQHPNFPLSLCQPCSKLKSTLQCPQNRVTGIMWRTSKPNEGLDIWKFPHSQWGWTFWLCWHELLAGTLTGWSFSFKSNSPGIKSSLALHSAPSLPPHSLFPTQWQFSFPRFWPSFSHVPWPCWIVTVLYPFVLPWRVKSGGVHCCFGVILRCSGAACMKSWARRRRPAVVHRGTGWCYWG